VKIAPEQAERLRFLARVVQREQKHLETTDARVFGKPFTLERARSLSDNVDEAERVEAFLGAFPGILCRSERVAQRANFGDCETSMVVAM